MLGSISRAVYESWVMGLGTDPFTGPLEQEMFLHLTKDGFTPDLDTDFSAVTPADFGSYAVRAIPHSDKGVGYNPFTGEMELNIPPPTGGLAYDTAGSVTLPTTVMGVVLSDDSTTFASGHALAYGVLDVPIEISVDPTHFDIPALNVAVNLAAVNSL